MRELTLKEVDEVSGGVGAVGAVLGGITGGAIAVAHGGGAANIISGVTLGAVSGFFGGIAGATSGITRYMFGAYSVETGVIGGLSGS